MFCRNCKNELSPQAIACLKCGVPPSKGRDFCQFCGASTHSEAVMCVSCGATLAAENIGTNSNKINSATKHGVSKTSRNTSAEPFVNTWGRHSYMNYVIIILFSALPFLNRERLEPVTGLQFAIGAEITIEKQVFHSSSGGADLYSIEQEQANVFSWQLAAFYGFMMAGLLLLLLGTTVDKFRRARQTSFAGLVALVIWFIYQAPHGSSAFYEVPAAVGFYLTLCVLIVTIVLLTQFINRFLPKKTVVVSEPKRSSANGVITSPHQTINDNKIVAPSTLPNATSTSAELQSPDVLVSKVDPKQFQSAASTATVAEVVQHPPIVTQHTVAAEAKTVAHGRMKADRVTNQKPSRKSYKPAIIIAICLLLIASIIVWYFDLSFAVELS
jgi:uncharacterized membrane protein YhaH (DUF805 family)